LYLVLVLFFILLFFFYVSVATCNGNCLVCVLAKINRCFLFTFSAYFKDTFMLNTCQFFWFTLHPYCLFDWLKMYKITWYDNSVSCAKIVVFNCLRWLKTYLKLKICLKFCRPNQQKTENKLNRKTKTETGIWV